MNIYNYYYALKYSSIKTYNSNWVKWVEMVYWHENSLFFNISGGIYDMSIVNSNKNDILKYYIKEMTTILREEMR